MRRKRRTLGIAFVVAAAVIGVALYMLWPLTRPDVPAQWRRVQIGMTRSEAIAVIPDQVNDLRDLKGFDTVTRDGRMLGGRCWWQLQLTYDAEGRVRHAEVSFTHPGCGLLNLGWRPLSQSS